MLPVKGTVTTVRVRGFDDIWVRVRTEEPPPPCVHFVMSKKPLTHLGLAAAQQQAVLRGCGKNLLRSAYIYSIKVCTYIYIYL